MERIRRRLLAGRDTSRRRREPMENAVPIWRNPGLLRPSSAEDNKLYFTT
jgi:hypothetical protein